MAVKVGINGFGRIGRLAFRAMYDDPEVEVVAVNDIGSLAAVAHLLKYDTMYGRGFDEVEVVDDGFVADGYAVKYLNEKNPANLPWGELGVEVVIEATGEFTSADAARAHIESGAQRVIITAASEGEDITIIAGVNHDDYDPAAHTIIAAGSSVTNCFAPVAKVLSDNFGVERGYLNTIHSYANDQKILDLPHKNLRNARCATMSMIPLPSLDARSVALAIPELEGKVDGFITRVPTPGGAMADLTFELSREVTIEEVNSVMLAAVEGEYAGIIDYTEDPIVSMDIIGESASAIFDSKLTMVLGGQSNMIKVIAWYDNEWAYSCRIADLVGLMAE
ncbi:MAG: aldehyde dehydrogenase [Eggerthellaceae bacterium]|nr:aldehyde dehydrogenase [Eggerthellaceae bacterium]